MTFLVPRWIREEIERHARAALPLECCGLLGGRELTALSCHPARNHSARPESEYSVAPGDLFRIMRELREAGEEMVAIYHSHPRGPAQPSVTDIRLAYYPSAVHLIIVPAEPPAVSAFLINDGRALPVVLREVD